MSESIKPPSNEAENGNKSKPLLGEVFIRIYCGVSIEDKCRHQLHPLNEVIQAQKSLSLNKSMDFYSNSPDFVSAIKYLCQEKSINCEFFLNGESTGNDIEPIFETSYVQISPNVTACRSAGI